MTDELKTMHLHANDEVLQSIREGAEWIAVVWKETEASAFGDIVAAGTKDECESAVSGLKLFIVHDGVTVHSAVWPASELGAVTP